MADYKKMYLALFNEVSKAIELLQNAQRKAEEMYISFDDAPPIHLCNSDDEAINKNEEE